MECVFLSKMMPDTFFYLNEVMGSGVPLKVALGYNFVLGVSTK